MNENIFLSTIIYRKKIFYTVALYLLVVIFFIILSIYSFKYKILQLFCLILFILPLILIKKIIKSYSRQIKIVFENDRILILVKKDDKEESFKEVKLQNIYAYKISFVNRRIAEIIFYSREEDRLEYSFLRENTNTNEINGDDFINIFQSFIRNNNALKNINLLPSFYASNNGLYCIIGLSILFLIAISLHFIYPIKPVSISLFFGLAIIIQLLIRRNTDMAYYKKNR